MKKLLPMAGIHHLKADVNRLYTKNEMVDMD